MAISILPTLTDEARYSFSIDLEDVEFKFDFEWNERAGAWLFSITDANGDVLLAGQRVIVGFPLLNRFRDIRLPAGWLEAVDTTGAGLDPAFADLGDRVKLLYIPSAEIVEEFGDILLPR